MDVLENKIVVYDSNCVVCTNLANALVKWKLIPQQQVTPYLLIPEKWQQSVDKKRFRNEMALIDQNTQQVLYGIEAILLILSEKLPLLHWFLKIPFLQSVANFCYKTIAFNRLIIYPPNSKGFVCDCEPDFNLFYRFVYFSFTALIAVLLTLTFGGSLEGYFPESDSTQLGINTLLICGIGWCLPFIGGFLLLPFQEAMTYIGNLGSIMVIGLLILIPSIVWDSFSNWHFWGIPIVSVVVSFGAMLYQHYIRAKYQQLSHWWTISWGLSLVIGAIGGAVALGIV